VTAFGANAVTVDLVEPHGSARHRWRGRVMSATPYGGVIRLLVRVDETGEADAQAGSEDTDLMADVTPVAAAELALVPGREVWLSVKETSVRSYDAPMPEPEPIRSDP
jgi:ABC-type molybdate transport system ATPase subunit